MQSSEGPLEVIADESEIRRTRTTLREPQIELRPSRLQMQRNGKDLIDINREAPMKAAGQNVGIASLTSKSLVDSQQPMPGALDCSEASDLISRLSMSRDVSKRGNLQLMAADGTVVEMSSQSSADASRETSPLKEQ